MNNILKHIIDLNMYFTRVFQNRSSTKQKLLI